MLEARLIPVPSEQSLGAMQSGTDIILMDLGRSEAQEETAGEDLGFLYLGEVVGTRHSMGLVTVSTRGSDVVQRVGFFEVSQRRQAFLEQVQVCGDLGMRFSLRGG